MEEINEEKWRRFKVDAPLEKQPSFNTTQTNIVSLLASLEADTFRHASIDNVHRSTTLLLDNFKSNMEYMQGEFSNMLEGFKEGTFRTSDLQNLLDEEHKKGLFTLSLAEDLMKFLEMIFGQIKVIVDQVNSGERIESREVNNIVEVLDQTLESVVGISRVASSLPRDVLRNMNFVQIKRADVSEKPEKGHFAQILQQFEKGNIISEYNTRELTLEEAVRAFDVPKISREESVRSVMSMSTTTSENGNNGNADDNSPAPLKKSASVRLHTFKVESAYLSRPPVFQRLAKLAIDETREMDISTLPNEISPEIAGPLSNRGRIRSSSLDVPGARRVGSYSEASAQVSPRTLGSLCWSTSKEFSLNVQPTERMGSANTYVALPSHILIKYVNR